MLGGNFIEQLQNNHERVKNYIGPSTEIGLTTALALKYTFANKSYSGVAFDQFHEEIIGKIKEQKWHETFLDLSTISTLTYKVIAHIYLSENRDELVARLLKNEARLKAVGFKKSIYRTIAALALSEDVSHETTALALYEEMSKKHRILTGKDDIPLAVVVTSDLNQDVVTRAQTMHRYYKELNEKGFKMGDGLQALSQILSIYNIHYVGDLVPYVAQIKNELDKRDIQIKRKHYAQIGLLALTMANTTIVNEIADTYEQLIATSMLKNEKSIALSIAIQYVVKQQEDLQLTIHLTQPHSLMNILGMTDRTLHASTLFIEGLTTFLPFDL